MIVLSGRLASPQRVFGIPYFITQAISADSSCECLQGGLGRNSMRRAHNSSATPDRRVTALSGAKHRQPAAPPPFRSYGSNGRALRQTMYARKRGTQESCVVSRQRAAASPYCKADNIQIGAQRTLQACRILTAATAAAVALQAAPAYAGQSPRCVHRCHAVLQLTWAMKWGMQADTAAVKGTL